MRGWCVRDGGGEAGDGKRCGDERDDVDGGATAEVMVGMVEVSGMAEMAGMAWVAVVVMVEMMMGAAVTEAWEAPMAEPKVVRAVGGNGELGSGGDGWLGDG
jgi:hypothetical protein